MALWITQLFNGLSLSSILLLIALGLAFSFGLMNVINMAHGEFIMAGATAVEVCTAAIMRGPRVYGAIAAQIGDWLDHHGYASLADIRGLTPRKLAARAS